MSLSPFFATILASDSESANSPCARDYALYFVKGNLHAAFATTNGRKPSAPSTACGWADGQKSKKIAVNFALSDCEKSQKKNPVSGKCKLIGVK